MCTDCFSGSHTRRTERRISRSSLAWSAVLTGERILVCPEFFYRQILPSPVQRDPRAQRVKDGRLRMRDLCHWIPPSQSSNNKSRRDKCVATRHCNKMYCLYNNNRAASFSQDLHNTIKYKFASYRAGLHEGKYVRPLFYHTLYLLQLKEEEGDFLSLSAYETRICQQLLRSSLIDQKNCTFLWFSPQPQFGGIRKPLDFK